MIETLEELEALPEETPIRDVKGFVWQSAGVAARYAELDGANTILPAVRLVPAAVSQEQFRQAYFAARDSYSERTGVLGGVSQEDLTVALAVLGIEVGDE